MIKKKYQDRKKRIVYLFLFIFYTNIAVALQIDYQIEGGLEYTDNANLTAINPISTAIRHALIYADINDQTEYVRYYFRPRISTTNYKNTTLEDRTFYGLDTSLSWEIVPRGFSWSFDDYLGQTAIDVRDPLTTNNVQTTNVFLTGPDVILRLSAGNRFEALIRYADFYYELSNIDNQRTGGLFRLIRSPSNAREYSINLDSAEIRYNEDTSYADYNRNDVFFEYRGLITTGNMDIISGVTKINRDIGEDLFGFIGKIESQVSLNSRSNISLYGHAQYTDSSRSFLLSRAYLEGIRTYDTQISADILYEKYLYAGYTWQSEVNTIDFSLLKTDQDYIDIALDAFDRDIERASLRYDRILTRLTSLSMIATVANTYYQSTFIDDKDRLYNIGINYRLSRSFVLNARARYQKRNSSDPTRNYIEKSGLLSINYSNRQ